MSRERVGHLTKKRQETLPIREKVSNSSAVTTAEAHIAPFIDSQAEKAWQETLPQDSAEFNTLINEVLACYYLFKDNPEIYSWPLSILLDQLVSSLRSASEENREKFLSLLTRVGENPGENGFTQMFTTLKYIETHSFNEDRDKYNPGLDFDQKRIAICKAYWHISARDHQTRIKRVAEYEKSNFGAERKKNNLFSLHYSNDIMHRINGHNLFKVDINVNQPEEKQRLDIYHHLMNVIGEYSIHRQKGTFTLETLSATALYEAYADIGVVKEMKMETLCRVANSDILNAIVFGLNNEQYPVSEEVKNKCLEIFNFYVGNKEGQEKTKVIEELKWSPDSGMDVKLMKSVNGAIAINHPIVAGLLIESINGTEMKKSLEFLDQDQFLQLKKIALGHPNDLYGLFKGLVSRIIDAIDREEYGEFRQGKGMVDVVREMKRNGLQLGRSVWFDLSEEVAPKKRANRPPLPFDSPREVKLAQEMKFWEATRKALLATA